MNCVFCEIARDRIIAESPFIYHPRWIMEDPRGGVRMALADLSVELEPHPGASAIFRIENIAEKFIEYYWNHATP